MDSCFVYSHKKYEGRALGIELLTMKKAAVNKLDMFTLDIHPRLYVSEKLRDGLERAGVTGIRFHEPEEPVLEIV
jgi:hypothetical protein